MIKCSHQDRKTLSCDINIKIIWLYQRVIFIVRFIHRILKFTFKLCAGSILGPSFKWKMLAVLKTSHWPEMPIDLQYLNLHFFCLDGNKPELADKSRGMNNWVKISQLRWKKVVLIISCPGNWRLAGIIISHIRETIKEDNCLLQVISWQKLIFLVRHDIISWYFWPSYLSYVHMDMSNLNITSMKIFWFIWKMVDPQECFMPMMIPADWGVVLLTLERESWELYWGWWWRNQSAWQNVLLQLEE